MSINVDKLRLFPAEASVMSGQGGYFNECCGITRGLIMGNIFSVPMDYGFNYATDFRLQGILPTTGGEDPYIGMQADCIYGALPQSSSPQWAGNVQLDMNFGDYTPNQILLARKYLMKGMYTLSNYQQIVDYTQSTGWGVLLAYKFYESFLTPLPDGTLPVPSGSYSMHCSPIWGEETQGLTINPLLGASYGDNGYCYMTETTLNLVSSYIIVYNPNANAFWNRAEIGLSHLNALPDVIPVLNL